ncbi:MAG: hypothetical protein HYR60_14535 [Acidobacteria bacterium]|nr:hypothetical protein [Acidobacteriota bacterium]MBI3470241.1 hypothetical protein [Candidatus Solibacter usitatus]
MTPATTSAPATAPPAAGGELTKLHAVMREQLDDLIAHAEAGLCDCPRCRRYELVRDALLEVFRD